MLQNLLSKKLLSTGAGIGSIAYIASLVAAGTLAPPIGLAFAGLAVIGAVVHVVVQGQVDKGKAELRTGPEPIGTGKPCTPDGSPGPGK